MKLSVRGEYALRALLVLGLNYDQPVVRIQTISEQQNVLEKRLLPMRRTMLNRRV